MGATNIPDEVKEAWDILAEITDLLGEISQWAGSEADTAITELHGKWHELCSNTETARSRKFIDECTKLLAECDSFRAEVVEKSQSFAANTKDKVSMIAELARDSEETRSLLEEIFKLWNEVEQPRLVFLYNNTAELESSIMEMMELAVRPIETATETTK